MTRRAAPVVSLPRKLRDEISQFDWGIRAFIPFEMWSNRHGFLVILNPPENGAAD